MCISEQVFTVRLKSGAIRKFLCPCGKCIECQKSKASQWAIRCLMEAEYYRLAFNRPSCVVTLTYSDNPINVSKRDFQLFIKRLRADLDQKGDEIGLSYFASGEYGEIGGRPHYHCCIFGWQPDDLYPWKRGKKGSLQFRSPYLEKKWTDGFVTVGQMSPETAFYSAKYLQKYLYDEDLGLEPPFSLMSRKPMLGLRYLIEYSFVDQRGKFFFNGQYYSLPRTFYKYLTEEEVESIMEYRYQRNADLLQEHEAGLMSEHEWIQRKKKAEKEREYDLLKQKANLQIQQSKKMSGTGCGN